MKRIETYIYHWFAPHFVFRIYSIYLEWKGLRLFFFKTFSAGAEGFISKESILYTLNEKDWDLIANPISMRSSRNLFYIPWMKRIETFPSVIVCYKLNPTRDIYSIYLEWKGLRQYYFYTGNESCMNESILYTLNEKDWDEISLFNWSTLISWSILYTLNEKDWDKNSLQPF